MGSLLRVNIGFRRMVDFADSGDNRKPELRPSFELANDNGGLAASNSFSASLDGLNVLSFSNLPNQNYVYEQYTFIASSGSTLLSFTGYNNQSYLELDNVAVAAAVVPEASSTALMMLGFLSVGLAVNRLRR